MQQTPSFLSVRQMFISHHGPSLHHPKIRFGGIPIEQNSLHLLYRLTLGPKEEDLYCRCAFSLAMIGIQLDECP